MTPAQEQLAAAFRNYAEQTSDATQRARALEFEEFARAHADCLLRTCLPGHFTGSAWVIDRARQRTLLTHHRKLDKWLQLGGHADGDADLLAVARREAEEESGLAQVTALSPIIFDLDRHAIPARGSEPAHWHYDVRFLFEADPTEPLVVTSESKDLSWVPLIEVTKLNAEESIARLVRNTPQSGR